MAITWRNEKERVCLAELYQKYANQEWFRGAAIIGDHPTTLTDTLEIAVNYHPRLIFKELVEVSERHGFPLYIKEVDAAGNRVNQP